MPKPGERLGSTRHLALPFIRHAIKSRFAPHLQALPDLAQPGPLHLVIDGAALVGTPLMVRGNTTTGFPEGRGLLSKPLLNGRVLRNAGGAMPFGVQDLMARAIGAADADGPGAAVATAGTVANFAGAGNIGPTTSGTFTNNGTNL